MSVHKTKISEIEGEVAELHPLLSRLLPELPTVQKIEYTQGPHEMGADFVLERRDPALNQTHYVGVIVKVGPIRQNHRDVDEQIRECAVERPFDGGTKRVFLSEIWVVTSGRISNNAKQKIHNNHATTSIRFIDGEALAKLLEHHLPDYWDDLPPDVSKYFARLSKRLLDQLHQSDSLAAIANDFYIELDLTEIAPKTSLATKRRSRSAKRFKQVDPKTLIEELAPLIVIEGEMGSGKTRLVRRIAEHYTQATVFQEYALLPIVYSCVDLKSEHDNDVAALIQTELGDLLNSENAERRPLVFLDGLDEVLIDSDEREEAIRELLDRCSQVKDAVIVLTTRSSGSLEPILGEMKDVRRLQIEPLSMAKLISFIEKLCEDSEIPKRLYSDAQGSDLFRQLPQSPIAAILLSRILEQTTADLPSTLTELYSQAMELLLGRWDVSKGLQTQVEYKASFAIAKNLAKFMLDNGLSQISQAEVLDSVTKYLQERNLPVESGQIFDRLFRRTGVFVLDDLNKTVSFRHRSFAEFLYASNQSGQQLPVDYSFFDPYWLNSRFFYVGLRDDCPDLLSELMAWSAESDDEKWAKMMSTPLYLLAAVMTSYEITEENLGALFLEMAQVFQSYRSRLDENSLKHFSQVDLLLIFRFIANKNFGYRFFTRAVESACIKISDANASSEEKQIALFFLASVSLDFGIDGPMKILLSTYKRTEMDVLVAAGLRVELENTKSKAADPLRRTYRKRWNKLLRGNPSVSGTLKQLTSSKK